jgi:hypothetical protein
VQQAPLSSTQKTEILRRQAFKCNECQTDLEPIGSAPAHFEQTSAEVAKGASITSNFRALCPACHAASSSELAKTAEAKNRRLRESGPSRTAKKFVKKGIDTRKF